MVVLHKSKLIEYSILLLLFLSSATVSAKEKPQVTLEQSAQSVWQRQQVLITLTVKTDDPFSRLEIDDFHQKGFVISPFEQQRIEKDNTVLLIMKWVIFPFISGKHTLQLPEILYRPNGGRKQPLDLKALSLQVRKLPVYVPPTMPVGGIRLQSQWEESWLTTPHNLLEWQIQVDGKGVVQQTMPPITRQLISTPSLQFLPTQNTHELIRLDQGINSQLKYKIPLKMTRSGKLNFPSIKVQFFEPISGKLQTAQLTPPFVLSINKWVLGLLILLILASFSIFLIFLFRVLRKRLIRFAQRKRALKQLAQAVNYQQIRDALNQFSIAHGWQENGSLTSFLANWKNTFGNNPTLSNVFDKLQAHEFSKNNDDELKNIIQLLVKALCGVPPF